MSNVAHTVECENNGTVTVHGKDIGTYQTVKAWIDDHQAELNLAFDAASLAVTIISVRKKH